MPLSWNEIKSRALTFSRTWDDAANEDSQAKPFWIDFFEIFGITNKRVATFEHAVKKIPAKAHGEKSKTDGFVDLFWPGMLLVEQKSRGKNLDTALTQALSYFPGIAERDLPQIIIVCDFARFRVHHLASGQTAVARRATRATPSAWRSCLSCTRSTPACYQVLPSKESAKPSWLERHPTNASRTPPLLSHANPENVKKSLQINHLVSHGR